MLHDQDDEVLDYDEAVIEDAPVVITKVYYPMDHAVRMAAVQNAKADYGQKQKFEKLSDKEQQCYLDTARVLLETTSQNQLPVYPETNHICLQKGKQWSVKSSESTT